LQRGEQPALQLAAGRLGGLVGAGWDEAPDERLGAGAVGFVAAEVRDGLEGCGDGEAAMGSGVKASRVMDRQAVACSGSSLRERDLDHLRHRGDELPEVGGGAVAQHAAIAGGEQPGDHARAVGERLVPDRIDAPVHADQPPLLRSARDLIAGEAERDELIPAHDATLPRGQPSQQNVAFTYVRA
jgi:hypothetical protein